VVVYIKVQLVIHFHIRIYVFYNRIRYDFMYRNEIPIRLLHAGNCNCEADHRTVNTLNGI
jgi:hypothetical protein